MQYKTGEFIVVPNISKLSNLKATSQSVFLCLIKYSDKHGRCHPGYQSIKNFTGIKGSTTISKAIQELVDYGFITYEKGNFKGKTNHYQIQILSSQKNGRNLVKKMDKPSQENGHKLYPRTISNNYIQVGVMACKSLDTNNYNSWFKNRTQRSAAEEVGKLSEKNMELLDFLVEQARLIHGKEYAPQIRSPWEFMQKLEKLKTYLKREGIIYKPVQDSSLEDEAQELGYSIYD